MSNIYLLASTNCAELFGKGSEEQDPAWAKVYCVLMDVPSTNYLYNRLM